MEPRKKLSSREKEQKIIEKIEKAKKDLAKLQDKRKSEIAGLARKHGLDKFDNEHLDKAFAKLAKELKT
jgi:hypothetical protein